MKKIIFLILIFLIFINLASASTINSYFTVNETNETSLTGQIFLSPEKDNNFLTTFFNLIIYQLFRI